MFKVYCQVVLGFMVGFRPDLDAFLVRYPLQAVIAFTAGFVAFCILSSCVLWRLCLWISVGDFS